MVWGQRSPSMGLGESLQNPDIHYTIRRHTKRIFQTVYKIDYMTLLMLTHHYMVHCPPPKKKEIIGITANLKKTHPGGGRVGSGHVPSAHPCPPLATPLKPTGVTNTCLHVNLPVFSAPLESLARPPQAIQVSDQMV